MIAELPIGSAIALKVRAQSRCHVSNCRRPASRSGSLAILRSRRDSRRGSRSQRFESTRAPSRSAMGSSRVASRRSMARGTRFASAFGTSLASSASRAASTSGGARASVIGRATRALRARRAAARSVSVGSQGRFVARGSSSSSWTIACFEAQPIEAATRARPRSENTRGHAFDLCLTRDTVRIDSQSEGEERLELSRRLELFRSSVVACHELEETNRRVRDFAETRGVEV